MRLIGANLGVEEGNYALLSSRAKPNTPLFNILHYLEKMYFELVEQSKTTTVNEFPTKDDRVILIPGMTNHRCSKEIDVLRGISEYGVLASEWFGHLESEMEGRFCTFVDRIKPETYPNAENENFRRLNDRAETVILFFDDENEIMKKLIHLDYFEYQKIKKTTTNKLQEIYSKEEMQLLGGVIEEFSHAGKDFHDREDRLYYYWSAIPGGIPPLLINGICIKNNEYTDEYIDELSKLFPNATIFGGNLKVIYKPTKRKQY